MVAVSGTVSRHKLIRGATMAAFVVPVLLVAGCAQPAPPQPQPVVYQPAPAPMAPQPTMVPRARG